MDLDEFPEFPCCMCGRAVLAALLDTHGRAGLCRQAVRGGAAGARQDGAGRGPHLRRLAARARCDGTSKPA